MYQQNQIFDNTYQIMGEVGKGGTGTVFLAWHLRLQKYVVLKEVRVQTPDEMARLRIEVDTLKSLHHPRLPQVYDFLQTESSVYTVMDYIEGVDLESYLKQGSRCPVDDLIRWFKQITEVLVYLESQNPPVIHSDIKPANIIITSQNEAMLIDFNVSLSHTTDTVVGLSMNYASPEQLNMMQQQVQHLPVTETMDVRSDIYSLCASFYHLISWKLPSVYYGVVPLSQMETEYPETFCDIIDKGMQIEKEERFSSAAEMQRSLNQMWKKTKGYKAYLAVQIAVILVAAFFLAFGAFQLIKGIKTKDAQQLTEDYNRCVQEINNGEPVSAISACTDFLYEYENQLGAYPEMKGNALLGLARSYEAQEDYFNAAENYEKAEECFSSADEELLECYSGAIFANLRTGNEVAAENILARAEEAGLNRDALSLLQAKMAQDRADKEACLRIITELETNCSDPEILSEAFLTAADCVPDTEAIDWLKKAKESAKKTDRKLDLFRKIGYRMLLLAKDTNSNIVDKAAYEDAADCYESIVSAGSGVANDYFNLETALRNTGKYDRALEVLEELENSKILSTDPGLIYLHKAMIFNERGNQERAKQLAKSALAELEESKVSAEEWQFLTELSNLR